MIMIFFQRQFKIYIKKFRALYKEFDGSLGSGTLCTHTETYPFLFLEFLHTTFSMCARLC